MGRKSDAPARLKVTARRLFHKKGYQTVGVAELCSEAEINKGSFYHFFSSKSHLLIEILSDAWDETGILQSWEQAPPPTPRAELRRYLRELFAYHYADWEKSGQVNGSFLGNLAGELNSHDADVVDEVRRLFARQRSAFATMLAAGYSVSERKAAYVGTTADSLVACIHGLLILARVRNDLSVLPASEAALLRLTSRT